MPVVIVTTVQGKEHTALEEIPDCLYRYDQGVRVEKTPYGGVLKVYTSLPSREAARIISSCWVSFVKRVVPVDVEVEARLEAIVDAALKLARGVEDSVAVRCVKRGSRIPSSKVVEEEVGAALKDKLGLKIKLEDPDYVLRVEVVGDEAYLSLLSREDLKPVEKRWPPRRLSAKI